MTNSKTARLAGVLYFLFALIGIFVFMYIEPQIMVRDNTAATVKNMLNNEFLFRIGKAAGVITNVLFIFVVLILYRLLKQVNEHQAKLMVALVIVSIPIALMGDALEISAQNIFKRNVLKLFQVEQAQDIGMTLIKISAYAAQMQTVFWGLWLLPLGMLVYKSRFIPKLFGVLLIVNGIGYVIHCFTFLLFPDQLETVLKFIFPTYFVGEPPFILWLLIKGIKTQKVINET